MALLDASELPAAPNSGLILRPSSAAGVHAASALQSTVPASSGRH